MDKDIIDKISQIIGSSVNLHESKSVNKIKNYINRNKTNKNLMKEILLIALKIESLPTEQKHSVEFQNIISDIINNLRKDKLLEFKTKLNNYIQSLDDNTKKIIERNLSVDILPDFDIENLDNDSLIIMLNGNFVSNSAELAENIEGITNTAQIDETIEHEYSHILSILLKKMETHLGEYIDANKPNKTNIEIGEDKNGKKIKFNNEEKKIGNKSFIIYKNTVNNDINNKITSDVSKNKLIITHKDNTKVHKSVTKDCFFTIIDYMTQNGKIPFVFNINGKSESYLENFYEILFKFSNKNLNTLNATEKANMENIATKISTFKINGIEISKNFISSCNSSKDIKTEMERLKNNMLNNGTALLNNANNSSSQQITSTAQQHTR